MSCFVLRKTLFGLGLGLWSQALGLPVKLFHGQCPKRFLVLNDVIEDGLGQEENGKVRVPHPLFDLRDDIPSLVGNVAFPVKVF